MPRAQKAELLAAGTRIGRYHLLQRLAVGGMAELYLACAEGLAGFQKVVVLKHVLPHLAEDPEFVGMFLNEARIAATLAHPNIVHVTDIGEASGDYFYVMEFVHGRNARELLRAGSTGNGIPLDVALTVAIATASALEHVHSARGVDGAPLGLIHRDVSPANILVSYEGTAKLTDFGIAKASEKSTETIGGAVKGKIGYMSPEQCRGERIDQRSDLFALGVVLFEITTCQRLFFGDNDFAILNKILTEQADRPSDRVLDYPAELEAIVMRAVASDPAERYSTAAEIRHDLETFAHEARLRCTPGTVAAWMREKFGDPRPPRVEVVRDPAAPEAPSIPTLIVSARTEEHDSQEMRAGPSYEGPATSTEHAFELPQRSRAPVWAAGIAVLAVGGGVLAWQATRSDPTPPAEAAEEALAQPAPASDEAEAPPKSDPPAEPEPPEIVVLEEGETEPRPRTTRPKSKKRPRKKKPKDKGSTPKKDMDNPFPVPL